MEIGTLGKIRDLNSSKDNVYLYCKLPRGSPRSLDLTGWLDINWQIELIALNKKKNEEIYIYVKDLYKE